MLQRRLVQDGPLVKAVTEIASGHIRKGQERPGHKYSERVPLPGGGYRYTYESAGTGHTASGHHLTFAQHRQNNPIHDAHHAGRDIGQAAADVYPHFAAKDHRQAAGFHEDHAKRIVSGDAHEREIDKQPAINAAERMKEAHQKAAKRLDENRARWDKHPKEEMGHVETGGTKYAKRWGEDMVHGSEDERQDLRAAGLGNADSPYFVHSTNGPLGRGHIHELHHKDKGLVGESDSLSTIAKYVKDPKRRREVDSAHAQTMNAMLTERGFVPESQS